MLDYSTLTKQLLTGKGFGNKKAEVNAKAFLEKASQNYNLTDIYFTDRAVEFLLAADISMDRVDFEDISFSMTALEMLERNN